MRAWDSGVQLPLAKILCIFVLPIFCVFHLILSQIYGKFTSSLKKKKVPKEQVLLNMRCKAYDLKIWSFPEITLQQYFVQNIYTALIADAGGGGGIVPS